MSGPHYSRPKVEPIGRGKGDCKLIKRSEFQSTRFEFVPVGKVFLLGSLNSSYPLRIFEKVSNKFATCEEFKHSTYYFHPEEKVYIESQELIADLDLEPAGTI